MRPQATLSCQKMLPALPYKRRLSRRRLFLKAPFSSVDQLVGREKSWSYLTLSLAIFCLGLIFFLSSSQGRDLISPLLAPLHSLSKAEAKSGYEVFGFAPFWKINDLDNVDFNTLTTLAYFGVPITAEGNLDKEDYGYTVFQSKKATALFQKAHAHQTRVVLTITQMDNETIEAFLSDPKAQETAIFEVVSEVKKRGLDGINVDFEYIGNPGQEMRSEFSQFVTNLTEAMHREMEGSRVTVSVYATSVSSPKLYDIALLSQGSDGIFMMAYDFSAAGSEKAMPTAPLYGKKEGKYPYDISTAVSDFLTVMPPEKLILGVPYYGYNYVVDEPEIKALTYPRSSWRGKSMAQTYEYALNNLHPEKTGWDETGQVGWLAYYVPETDTWRMLFLDDKRSLSAKYDFAKEKQLMGVGLWALGFDNGKDELWSLLREKFGSKNLADNHIILQKIKDNSL